MAKILVSSLGTGIKKDGGYIRAKYEFNGKVIETTFISKALVEFLNIDKLFLVGTKGSIWDSCYIEFGGNDEKNEMDLYEQIENRNLTLENLDCVNFAIDSYTGVIGSKCFLIDYGINDQELWSNFNNYLKILDYISDGDEVYIDISHSFRSLALMSFLMIQFGHIVKDKKFKIGGIFYGMLEYRGENDGITPIVDLKIFYELMEWIKAVDVFKNYSNADLIANLLKDTNTEEYKIFNNISRSIKIANMASLQESIKNIAKKIDVLKKSDNPIVSMMSDEIVIFINRLNKENLSDFQLELADWYYEHNNYALSYIALAESIITRICEKYDLKITDKEAREEAKKIVSSKEHKELSKVFKSVNKVRNNIAHQLSKRNDAIEQDIKNLPMHIEKVRSYFKKMQ